MRISVVFTIIDIQSYTMRKLLSYITQPSNALALLFLVAFAVIGAFFWHDGGKQVTLWGSLVVVVFWIGSAVSSSKKKP